jgi:hypothetical protein
VQVLIGYQGKPIAGHPNSKCFNLGWATQGPSGPAPRQVGVHVGAPQAAPQVPQVPQVPQQPAVQAGMDYPIFVGDLAHEVTLPRPAWLAKLVALGRGRKGRARVAGTGSYGAAVVSCIR